jgi:hypothetical protein
MMDPREFKAPFIKIEDLREAVDDFRIRYWHENTLPVNIFEIVEFELGIEIRTVFNLREAGDVDALLLGDLKTIVVDQNDFLNDRAQKRLRFSIAHEIGHLILHRDTFSKIQYSSVGDWIAFFQNIPEEQYYWIEQHAYEFAGRLLVPREELMKKLNDAVLLARRFGFDSWDSSGDSACQFVSHGIAKYFEVSDQVIEKRLIRESLWPPAVGE